jgi:hypothetical protein
MGRSSRRRFLLELGALVPLPLVARRLHPLAVADLDPSALRAVGEAILPGELGRAGVERTVRGFERWLRDYREGAELVHGYGTGELRTAGPSPALRWSSQLRELQDEADRRHSLPLDRLTVTQREALIREALAGSRGNLLQFDRARHVALGLLGFFYASPEAADLCYQARIGAMSCRRLDQSGAKPLPLAGTG